ncbi:hypothetical protein ZWY2020_008417 [Hordeum vulgare]|nr:hypothetical protein ZWY2020_008417 [Hordeum vulgare]
MTTSTNHTDAWASLEQARWQILARRQILEEGIAIATAKHQMEATQREYNSAYGLTPVSRGPSRLGSVRGHGHGRVIADILGSKQPIYETHAANLPAAHAAMAEMPDLEASRPSKRVKDLLSATSEQHAA